MRIYFSTVIRSAPPLEGGELVALDWNSKRVLGRVPIAPVNPTLHDPNKRGNTRGGRGIHLIDDDELVVCSFHSLCFFGRDLSPRRTVSHGLMVSLHEVAAPGDGSLWTTSTAIDAALRFDLETGDLLDARWPREDAAFQRELGLTPLEIAKDADNRGLFLGSAHYKHPHHLHLNAVAVHRGELLALFSKHGVIANLDRSEIVIRDKALNGAHNLVLDGDRAFVSHTVGKGVLEFDLASGRRARRIRFGDAPPVRRLTRRHFAIYRLKRFLERYRLHPPHPPRPLFVRGLDRHGGSLFVGVSPATILEIDEESGDLVDLFTYRREVNACVHGLRVDPTA